MRKRIALLLSGAMILSSMAFGVSAETKAAEEREHVTLEFYTRVKEQPDQQAVFDKLNEYLEEELNTTVNWHFLGGEFNDKISAIINTGEQYDACYTASIANYYVPNVAKGAFADLTDLLEDYPDLWNAMPEAFWDAVRVDGKIYAVPNQQIAVRHVTFEVPTKFLESTGYTVEDLEATGGSLGDLEEYLQAVYDEFGVTSLGIIPTALDSYLGYEMLGGVKSGIGIKYDDPDCTVVNVCATEEFRQMCEDIYDLAQKGLLICELPGDSDYYNGRIMSEESSAFYTGVLKPGVDAELTTKYGVDYTAGGYGTPYMTSSAVCATMWGISSTSKYPERTLEVLQMLNTDEYAVNLIAYGIEGTHWEFTDDTQTTIRLLDGGYSHASSWALCNVFKTYPTEGQPADVWEQTAEINENALKSPLLGFSYSQDNVEIEVADVSNAMTAGYVLYTGQVDVDEGIADLLSKMEAAGVDKMIEDAQAQVDAFLGK